MQVLLGLMKALFNSFKDLLPIIAVIVFFQFFILRQPLPDFSNVVAGLILVVFGLTFFVFGLQMGLFPIGESLAQNLATRGSLLILISFSFCLGFGTTIAEPALTAVAMKAANVAATEGVISALPDILNYYAWSLRIIVAVSVGVAIVLGVVRILMGWPIHRLIIGGYLLVVLLTFFAPQTIIGIAYDSGGVTTSTITVPLVTALGVGLSSIIKGKNPMIDGFGLIAFASLLPMIFVLIFGMVIA